MVLWSHRDGRQLRINTAVLSHDDRIQASCDINTGYNFEIGKCVCLKEVCDGTTIHVFEQKKYWIQPGEPQRFLPPYCIDLDSFHCKDNPKPFCKREPNEYDKLIAYRSYVRPPTPASPQVAAGLAASQGPATGGHGLAGGSGPMSKFNRYARMHMAGSIRFVATWSQQSHRIAHNTIHTATPRATMMRPTPSPPPPPICTTSRAARFGFGVWRWMKLVK